MSVALGGQLFQEGVGDPWSVSGLLQCLAEGLQVAAGGASIGHGIDPVEWLIRRVVGRRRLQLLTFCLSLVNRNPGSLVLHVFKITGFSTEGKG